MACNGASSARSAALTLLCIYNAIAFAVAGDYWHKERELADHSGEDELPSGTPTKSLKKILKKTSFIYRSTKDDETMR